MRIVFSEQYKRACVVLDGNTNVNEIICKCQDVEAWIWEPIDNARKERAYIVDVGRGVGPELYTAAALRRTFRPAASTQEPT